MNDIIQFSIHHEKRKIWNWFPNDVIKKWLCIENFRKFQNYFSCSSLLTLQHSPANHLISHLSARNSSIITEPHNHAEVLWGVHTTELYTIHEYLCIFSPFFTFCPLHIVHSWPDMRPCARVLPRTVAVIMRCDTGAGAAAGAGPATPGLISLIPEPEARVRREDNGAMVMVSQDWIMFG